MEDIDAYDYLERTTAAADVVDPDRISGDDRVRSKSSERRDESGRRISRDDEKDRERNQDRRSRDRGDGERYDRRSRERGDDDRRDRRSRERGDDHRRDRRSKERGDDDRRDRRSRDRRSREDEEERERKRSGRSSSKHEMDDEIERERRRRGTSKHERDDEIERERRRRGSSKHERDDEIERERRRSGSSKHEIDDEIERERRRRSRSRERRAMERDRELESERRRLKERKESVEPEADPERDQRTVFAYQMPLKATERDVYEFFSRAGKVRDVRLIMDRLSRRSKGVGYIEFYDVMAVPYAIALSNDLLLGQPVMVKASEAEKNLVQSNTTVGVAGVASDRKIYVGNLHYSITEAQLRQVFEVCGPLELVQLPLDPTTGHCKGYGFIQYAQLEHAKVSRNLNGTLDIAGRTIKVSAVTDHVGGQNGGTNVADFDDEDGGGLTLNARSRAVLMSKLDRTGTATSIVESLGMPGLNGVVANPQAASLAINGLPMLSAISNSQNPTSFEPIGDPSECLLLKNMFDPSAETDPDFYLDIKEDVEDECSKFGSVRHIHVDRNSSGFVYVRFDSVASAAGCRRALDKRFFAGRSISATFMRPHEYEAKFSSHV